MKSKIKRFIRKGIKDLRVMERSVSRKLQPKHPHRLGMLVVGFFLSLAAYLVSIESGFGFRMNKGGISEHHLAEIASLWNYLPKNN